MKEAEQQALNCLKSLNSLHKPITKPADSSAAAKPPSDPTQSTLPVGVAHNENKENTNNQPGTSIAKMM